MQLEFVFADKEETKHKYVVVNWDDYNLIFYDKNKVTYLGTRAHPDKYILLSSDNGRILKMNRYQLRRDFKPNRKLNERNKKRFFMNYGKKRVC